jgi:hypothetical protein
LRFKHHQYKIYLRSFVHGNDAKVLVAEAALKRKVTVRINTFRRNDLLKQARKELLRIFLPNVDPCFALHAATLDTSFTLNAAVAGCFALCDLPVY